MSSYVKFDPVEQKPRTAVYFVRSVSSDDPLGKVSWYGAWMRYVFFPLEGTAFDSACLGEIREFMDTLMKEREALK